MKVEITGGFSDFSDLAAALTRLGEQVKNATTDNLSPDGLSTKHESARLRAKIITSCEPELEDRGGITAKEWKILIRGPARRLDERGRRVFRNLYEAHNQPLTQEQLEYEGPLSNLNWAIRKSSVNLQLLMQTPRKGTKATDRTFCLVRQ